MKANKKHYLIYLLIALFLCNNSFAQNKVYPNTLKFASNAFYIKDRYKRGTPFAQIGGFYENRIYKNWWIGIGYMQWKSWGTETLNKQLIVGEPLLILNINQLHFRETYKMIDLYGFYKLNIFKDHYINAGIGASYCWGKNIYLKDYIVNPEPPHDAILYYERKNETYWGMIPQISYNFLCLKNRLSLGLDMRSRHYFKRSPAQYDYGFHAGFNF